jgi:hypothetical protein
MRGPSEWSNPTRLTVAFGVVLTVALLIAAGTSTTAFGAYNTAWDGTSNLRSVAESTGTDAYIAQNVSAYSMATPQTTVALIIAPDNAYQPQETAQIGRFVRQGGTLVVAEERVAPTNPLLTALSAEARIGGPPLRDARYHYRSPAAPQARALSNDSLMANVSALTLNHGTAVEQGNTTVLANTSEYAYLDTNRNQELDQSEPVTQYPVLTSEAVGEGRVIVIGDSSLFINEMLEQSGNRQFVHNLFARHETLLLDYSHTATLPPLVQGLLLLRQTPFLQFLGGGLGVLIIGLLQILPSIGLSEIYRRRRRSQPTPEDGDGDDTATTSSPVTDQDLVTHLRTQYPEWDETTLQRIVAARRHETNGEESTRQARPASPYDHDA